MELWDDCMSFPGLLVRVKRHRRCVMDFLDENWQAQQWILEDDLSELIQHEYDHLDGILATQRAIDDRSFRIEN
jgi:peptide deformylase